MSTRINCYSKPSEWLRYISYAVLIIGIISYLSTVFVLIAEWKLNAMAFLIALPILVGSGFSFAVGLCVSAITLNSEQQSAYLHYKAKTEDIEFEYFD